MKSLINQMNSKKMTNYTRIFEEVVRCAKKKKPYQYILCFDMASLEIDL